MSAKVNYRRDLEKAAKQMILIHRADTLMKLILRMVVRATKVTHAGMLVYDNKRDEYVTTVSKGKEGFRIPSGFVKVKKNNPLIRYFTDDAFNFPKNAIIWDDLEKLHRTSKVRSDNKTKDFLDDLMSHLALYQAKVCIPGFFRKDLVGILFLGEKKNNRNFNDEELGFLSVLASDVVMTIKNAWLIEDLNNQLDINKRLFLQTVLALSSSIEAKDKYTVGHTERVTKYSLAIAEELRRKKKVSNGEKFMEDLRVAALLHDIGKIGIPESILNKEAALNDEERSVMQNHPAIGARILENIEEFREVLEGVKYHHEKFDGSGYPFGLKGKKIPLIASIIALADAFDAMVTDRPYRKALKVGEALMEIKKNKGKQFAPQLVDVFMKSFKSKGNKIE